MNLGGEGSGPRGHQAVDQSLMHVVPPRASALSGRPPHPIRFSRIPWLEAKPPFLSFRSAPYCGSLRNSKHITFLCQG